MGSHNRLWLQEDIDLHASENALQISSALNRSELKHFCAKQKLLSQALGRASSARPVVRILMRVIDC